MRKSKQFHRAHSGWINVAILLCAMIGVASAQDFEAVERRLGEAVAEGELSLEQAFIMMEALKDAVEDEHENEGDIEQRLKEWIEDVGHELKKAVEKGKLSESDAWEKWRYFKEKELAPKLKALVKERKLSDKAASEFWEYLEDAKKEREHEDESASADKQKWIAEALMERGKLDRDQIRPTLAILPRVVHELQKSKADDIDKFKLSEGVQKYFMDEIGLKAEQIKLVVGIAHRLQLAKNDGTHTD